MTDVFISYKREDGPKVVALARALETAGLSVWYDYALLPGDQWFGQILDRVRQSRCVIACWSPAAVAPDGQFLPNSDGYYFAQIEQDEAYKLGKLLPVVLSSCALPLQFKHLQAAQLDAWDENPEHPVVRSLIERIVKLAAPVWMQREVTRLNHEAVSSREQLRFLEQQNSLLLEHQRNLAREIEAGRLQLEAAANEHAETLASANQLASAAASVELERARVLVAQIRELMSSGVSEDYGRRVMDLMRQRDIGVYMRIAPAVSTLGFTGVQHELGGTGRQWLERISNLLAEIELLGVKVS